MGAIAAVHRRRPLLQRSLARLRDAARRDAARRDAAILAAWTLGVATLVTLAVVLAGPHIPWLAWDTGAYWDALRSPHPYEGSRVGGLGAYLYSPVFLQLLAPAGMLPWPAFVFAWTAMNTAAAVLLLRRVPAALRSLLPTLAFLATMDVWAGNINVLLAWALVIGLRRPSAWAFVLVTKVTPGVGLLWFAFAARWRELIWALALTAGMVGISVIVSPQLWRDWTSLLLAQAQPGIYPEAVPLPAYARLPLAIAIVWWGARNRQPAMVPIAAFLCLPVIWINGLAVLIGAAALMRPASAPEQVLLPGSASAGSP